MTVSALASTAPIVPTAKPDLQDPVALARTLVPLLAEHAAEAEHQRRMTAPVLAALRASGLFQMMFPRRAGGVGHTLITQIETVAELGRGCPGSAWAFGLLTGVTASAASMSPDIRRLVFQRGDERVCSVAGQMGTARAVEGGYVVDGAWAYASGCLHADWALNGVRILDADGQQVDAGFAFLPLGGPAVSIDDSWHIAGLCASGSNTVVARQAFVAQPLVLRFSQLRAAAGKSPAAVLEARDRWPVEPLFPLGVLAPMLGAAMALQDLVAANMPRRVTVGWKYASQAESETMVGQFGEAAMEIDSAWLHVRRAVRAIDETAQTRGLSGFEKARIQADCGYAMRQLRRAGERLMEIAGPGAFAQTSPLQRLWRDLSVGTRHTALNTMLSHELYGRALLEKDSNLHLLGDIRRAA
ncbi:MAG: acyl-CoA dehydrogenase family protein [Rhodoferax sp.]|nr:acyl-CoA dehydrogenase family protein [Rhodoferax sp.]